MADTREHDTPDRAGMHTPPASRVADSVDVDVEESQRLKALSILSEVSASLADEDDVEELLGRFLGTMLRLANANAGAVRVLTADGRHLRLVAARGLPREVVEYERLVPVDCGQCGSAIRDQRPLE